MKYELVCFDVDGTLISNLKFSWQLFHDAFGSDKEKRATAMAAFKRGDITYLEWAYHDISMWKQMRKTKQDFFDALKNSPIALLDNARETIEQCKEAGMKVAVISGSLSVLLEHFFPDCEELFDDIFISKIDFDEQGNIVDIVPTEYDMEHKATALKIIADREKIDLSKTVFVGDYLNDVEALKTAGLGIAFNAKEQAVKDAADISVDTSNLRDLLPYVLDN